MIARLKPDSGAVCLATYPLRAKPIVPVLRDRCSSVYIYIIVMLVERCVLTVIKTIIIIRIMICGNFHEKEREFDL